MKWYLIILAAIVLYSCNSKTDPAKLAELQQKGNEISNLAQSTLLANVGKAIQKGGTEYAVEFCNLKASSIIDSLNGVNNCTISRVSAKNRNPENNLKGNAEKELWELFQQNSITDTVLQNKQKFIYYKSITIALPACLKCHGTKETEINSATLKKLQTLYPDDLATDYKMNDFRGLWKIEFAEN